MTADLYGADLAHVHDEGFDFLVRAAGPFLLGRLRAAGIDEGLVVDLGCGGGIWAAELLAAGYDVLGVDVSATGLEIARKRAPRARFVHGSIHEVELPHCVAVTAIGEVVDYEGPPTLAPLLARIHDALAPGGLLAFDVAAPGREPAGVRRARHEGDGWAIAFENAEDRERCTLTRTIEVERAGRRTHEVHRLRLYEPAEVVGWLEQTGFAVERREAYGVDAPCVPGLHVYLATRAPAKRGPAT